MKIKTSELTPLQIDLLVATCEGHTVLHDPMGYGTTANGGYWVWEDHGSNNPKACYWKIGGGYSPTTNWSQGGPIGERELLTADPYLDNDCKLIQWSCRNWKGDGDYFYGPTELIAKMRCYVASKLGDEVNVPEELV